MRDDLAARLLATFLEELDDQLVIMLGELRALESDPADDERCIAWARKLYEETRPFARGVYVNFLSDEGRDRVREAYPPETWDRLLALKHKYDPGNVFRMNQNIAP